MLSEAVCYPHFTAGETDWGNCPKATQEISGSGLDHTGLFFQEKEQIDGKLRAFLPEELPPI